MAGAWIFQGNPAYYDVAGAVRALPSIEWVVRQYKKRIEAGDAAYIWETGGTGFVARAVVAGSPVIGLDDDDDDSFQRGPERVRGPELYAPLSITEVFDPPISRAKCLADPVLRTLPNLRFPNATNYPVTPEQEAAIETLLAQAPGPVVTASGDRPNPGSAPHRDAVTDDPPVQAAEWSPEHMRTSEVEIRLLDIIEWATSRSADKADRGGDPRRYAKVAEYAAKTLRMLKPRDS